RELVQELVAADEGTDILRGLGAGRLRRGAGAVGHGNGTPLQWLRSHDGSDLGPEQGDACVVPELLDSLGGDAVLAARDHDLTVEYHAVFRSGREVQLL